MKKGFLLKRKLYAVFLLNFISISLISQISDPSKGPQLLMNSSFDQGLDSWTLEDGNITANTGSITTYTRTRISQAIPVSIGESFLVYYEFEVLNASDVLEIVFSNQSGISQEIFCSSNKAVGTYSGWHKMTSLGSFDKITVTTLNNYGADSKIKEIALYKSLSSTQCTSGNNGMNFGEYGGGFHMIDSDWIRICGEKGLYQSEGILRTDGELQVGLDHFFVNQNGKVGIGTTSPDELLTVKGNIHSREVLIDMEGAVAADYVFEKYYNGISDLKADYEIPTLEEVETFTKKYKHLPSIPSAKELDKNGMRLKEMTNLLLEKIEELTLYTIEQEKRLDKQQELNEKQSKEIELLKKELQSK